MVIIQVVKVLVRPTGRVLRGLANLDAVGLFLVGWVILGIAFVTLQWRFLSIYQATYNAWRPRNTPWLLTHSPRESLEQLRATFRRDANPKVEDARRLYLAILALTVLYLVVGFPLAVWLFG